MSPAQCRAARGWLGWSQSVLAGRAGVSLSTIRDFETGRRTPMTNNFDAIVRVFWEFGVTPVSSTDGRMSGIEVATLPPEPKP